MHIISVDAPARRIDVRLAGTMSADDVEAYMTELRRVLVDARLAADYGIVIDVVGCTIQTQDMIAAMGRRMASMPRAKAIAIVATSQLARMQIRRLFKQDYARLTSSFAEGRDWVSKGVEPGIGSAVAQAPHPSR